MALGIYCRVDDVLRRGEALILVLGMIETIVLEPRVDDETEDDGPGRFSDVLISGPKLGPVRHS